MDLFNNDRDTTKSRVFLGGAVFVWLASLAWLRPLSLPDEGRYVGVALEMLWSGDWLVPTLDTLPYFHKPPLFYWLTGASLAAFGINEWAARLPSLLAGTGTALALYLFVGRWISRARARLAVIALTTTPFFVGGSQFANLDTLVMACIAATIPCAADAILAAENGRPRRLTLVAAYAFAALGLLAKGLIGVVIPALVIGAWLLVTRRPAMMLRLISPLGLLLFTAAAVPWFVLVDQRYPGFLQYFFVHQHFDRFTGDEFNGHAPFWFYAPLFAGATLPWFAFLVPAARNGPAEPTHKSIATLMWLWLGITLVFFSIPASKLIGYVLVAVPPFAVLAADGLARFAAAPTRAQRWLPGVPATGVALCLAGLITATLHDRNEVAALAKALNPLLASPDSSLIVMRTYPFSLPFYLRRPPPLPVVYAWGDPHSAQRDNWRQELHEAANFAPQRSRTILVEPQQLSQSLMCTSRTVLVVAPSGQDRLFPELAGQLRQKPATAHFTIWRNVPVSASTQPQDCGP